jgi:hypothetical protein
MPGRSKRKVFQSTELPIAEAFVETWSLEPIGINPAAVATPRHGLGLKALDQAPTQALASQRLVYPQQAEVEPAVMSVAVDAA